MEGVAKDWRVESIELDQNTEPVENLLGGIETLDRDSVERNGRVRVGDALDVVGEGWGVKEALGD